MTDRENLIPVHLKEGAAKAACAAAKADGRSLSDWLHGLIWAAVHPDETEGDAPPASSPTVWHGPEGHVVDPSRHDSA